MPETDHNWNRHLPQAAAGAPATTPAPSWKKDEIVAVQRQLARLGLYRLALDGDLGRGSQAGLVEAFAGDEWRRLPAADVLGRLVAAAPSPGPSGQHRLRFGEMTRDGVLDVTVGIGYDEGGAHTAVILDAAALLRRAGFVEDRAAAAALYRRTPRAAPPDDDDVGRFYVRRAALTMVPPADPTPRPIDAVVRLVSNQNGDQGAAAAAAFRDGMAWSDVIYYAGHARYGSGPDFDRNMTFELAGDDGRWSTIDDYEALERILATGGRDPWAQFKALTAADRLRVHGYNQGNIFLNPVDQHTGEFGGRLMYWNLQRQSPDGSTPMTGNHGPLAQDPEGRYRLWIFDGCRTQDYLTPIRSTPEHDPRSADIVITRRITYWNDKGACFGAFLDSLLAGATCEQLLAAMDATHVTLRPTGADAPALRGDGVDDNPIIP